MKNIAVFGSSGSIGSAFVELLAKDPSNTIHAFSRHHQEANEQNVRVYTTDYSDHSLSEGVSQATEDQLFDTVIVTNGTLHNDSISPEKSFQTLSEKGFMELYRVNTVIPALIAKHTIPRMRKDSRSIFAALSARVGSITDNRLGGWYSYRASKAALNMVIKNLAIEIKRFNTYPIIVGLHPGTVDSALSKPYQKNVPAENLFTPTQSATYLLSVIEHLKPSDTGICYAWDGTIIET